MEFRKVLIKYTEQMLLFFLFIVQIYYCYQAYVVVQAFYFYPNVYQFFTAPNNLGQYPMKICILDGHTILIIDN